MNCPQCNAEIRDGSVFCPQCGAPTSSTPAPADLGAVNAGQPAYNQHATSQPSPAAPVVPPAASYQQPAGNQAYDAYQQPGQNQAQGAYQQQYQQPFQQPGQAAYQQPASGQKVYAETTGTSRALAMCAYWGLLPLIFAYVVGDKDTDPFIRHHVNDALVLFIGGIISSFLMLLIIGFIAIIFLFVMVIMGTVRAYHGEITPLPLISSIKILK